MTYIVFIEEDLVVTKPDSGGDPPALASGGRVEVRLRKVNRKR